jgi:hypothetical protein
MGDKDEVGRNLFDLNRRQRIAGYEWIHQQPRLVSFNQQASVTVPSDFDIHLGSPFSIFIFDVKIIMNS